MRDNLTLNKISEEIKNCKKSCKSLVLSHQNPDGDTLGSMLALGSILKELGHVVDFVIADPVPEIYQFLPFASLVKLPSDSTLQGTYDFAFSLDCGSAKRLGQALVLWNNASNTINIDHHISNEKFAKINWIEPNAVSTGQLIWWLTQNINFKVTKEIATLLYTTLLTDTGCFSNSSTNAEAFLWGAELINSGADYGNVYRKVFLEKPFKSIKTFGSALSNVTLLENGKLIWTYINQDVMKKMSATGEDTEDVVDYMMRTKGVQIGVFFREDLNETKVSLRSNTQIDVSKIAVTFGGGGHKKAAGINIKSPFVEVKDLVLKKVIDELNVYGEYTRN